VWHNGFVSLNENGYRTRVSNTRPAMLFGIFMLFWEVVCVPAVALQTKFSLSSKFLRNLGTMQKTPTHALSIAMKHTTRFLVKSCGECCGGTVLTAACYWPSSHCIPAQKFVSVSGELNHDRSPLLLDPNKGVRCHHSFKPVVLNVFFYHASLKSLSYIPSPPDFK